MESSRTYSSSLKIMHGRIVNEIWSPGYTEGTAASRYSQDASSKEPRWPQAPGVPEALQTKCPKRPCCLQKNEQSEILSENLSTKPTVSPLK